MRQSFCRNDGVRGGGLLTLALNLMNECNTLAVARTRVLHAGAIVLSYRLQLPAWG